MKLIYDAQYLPVCRSWEMTLKGNSVGAREESSESLCQQTAFVVERVF